MVSEPENRPGNIVFAIILAGFSAVALWQAYEISGFKGFSEPGVFPMLAAGTMLLSGLFIVRDAVLSSRRASAPEPFFKTVLPLRLIIVVALVALYIALMPWLGFMAASAGFLYVAFVYLWGRGLVLSALLTAGTLACLYFIFRIVFQVVLPKGSLLPGLF